MPEPIARLSTRSAFRALSGDSEAFREVVVTFWSYFLSALRLVGELREVGHRDFERPGDPLHGGPRRAGRRPHGPRPRVPRLDARSPGPDQRP